MVAGTVTAVYFCLGGVLLGSIGTLIISLLPRNTAWPGCRVLFDPCNSRARSVLCFPSEGLSRPGSCMMPVALQSAESTSNPNR